MRVNRRGASGTQGRRYEVRGIAKGENKLKATVKGIGGDGGKKRFHVDTVDFYSARSRAFLVKGLEFSGIRLDLLTFF